MAERPMREGWECGTQWTSRRDLEGYGLTASEGPDRWRWTVDVAGAVRWDEGVALTEPEAQEAAEDALYAACQRTMEALRPLVLEQYDTDQRRGTYRGWDVRVTDLGHVHEGAVYATDHATWRCCEGSEAAVLAMLRAAVDAEVGP